MARDVNVLRCDAPCVCLGANSRSRWANTPRSHTISFVFRAIRLLADKSMRAIDIKRIGIKSLMLRRVGGQPFVRFSFAVSREKELVSPPIARPQAAICILIWRLPIMDTDADAPPKTSDDSDNSTFSSHAGPRWVAILRYSFKTVNCSPKHCPLHYHFDKQHRRTPSDMPD